MKISESWRSITVLVGALRSADRSQLPITQVNPCSIAAEQVPRCQIAGLQWTR